MYPVIKRKTINSFSMEEGDTNEGWFCVVAFSMGFKWGQGSRRVLVNHAPFPEKTFFACQHLYKCALLVIKYTAKKIKKSLLVFGENIVIVS